LRVPAVTILDNVDALALAGHLIMSHPVLLLTENIMLKITTKSSIHNVLLEHMFNADP